MIRSTFVVFYCCLVVTLGLGCSTDDSDAPSKSRGSVYHDFTDSSTTGDDDAAAPYSSPDSAGDADDASLPDFIPGTRETQVFFLESFDVDDALKEEAGTEGMQKTRIECQL